MAYRPPSQSGGNQIQANKHADRGGRILEQAFENPPPSPALIHQAIDEFRRCLALVPGDPFASHRLAICVLMLLRYDEDGAGQLELIHEAVALLKAIPVLDNEPSLLDTLADLIHRWAARVEDVDQKRSLYDEAIATWERSQELDEDDSDASIHKTFFCALSYAHRGTLTEGDERYAFFQSAARSFDIVCQAESENLDFRYNLANSLFDCGRSAVEEDERKSWLDQSLAAHHDAIQLMKTLPTGPEDLWYATSRNLRYNYACLLSYRGDSELAISVVEELLREGSYRPDDILADSDFEPLVNNEAFVNMMRDHR